MFLMRWENTNTRRRIIGCKDIMTLKRNRRTLHLTFYTDSNILFMTLYQHLSKRPELIILNKSSKLAIQKNGFKKISQTLLRSLNVSKNLKIRFLETSTNKLKNKLTQWVLSSIIALKILILKLMETSMEVQLNALKNLLKIKRKQISRL